LKRVTFGSTTYLIRAEDVVLVCETAQRDLGKVSVMFRNGAGAILPGTVDAMAAALDADPPPADATPKAAGLRLA